MSTCINSGQAKLHKYYTLTSKTPAYVGTLVLHLAYKWQYIKEHWMCEWWAPAKAALEDLQREKYMPIGLERLLGQDTTTGPALAPIHTMLNKFTQQKNSLKAKVPTTLYQDKYT